MKRAWRVVLAATFLLGRGPAAWAEPPIFGPPDKRVELEGEDTGTSGAAVAPHLEELPRPTAVAPPVEELPHPTPYSADDLNDSPCVGADVGVDAEGPSHGHFTAGAGLYCLQPYFQTNPAYGTVRAGSAATNFQQEDFRYGMHAEPLAWLGFVNDSGLGVRVRWWQYNVASGVALVGPFPGGNIQSAPVFGIQDATSRGFSNAVAAFASDLHLNVWDLEVSKSFAFGSCAGLLSGGVRYTHMAQDYVGGFVFNDIAGGVGILHDILAFSHNFNGAGPTIAIEGHRPLGRTGVALYGCARGSVLFGSAHQRLFRQSDVVGPPFSQTEADAASVLPIGELECGAEYGHSLGCLDFFAQVAFVGQVWFGAGNASNTDGIYTSGSGNSSNLGLVGLAVRAGVEF